MFRSVYDFCDCFLCLCRASGVDFEQVFFFSSFFFFGGVGFLRRCPSLKFMSIQFSVVVLFVFGGFFYTSRKLLRCFELWTE